MSATSVTGSPRTSHSLSPFQTPHTQTLGSRLDPSYLPTLHKCVIVSAKHAQAHGELRLVGQFTNSSITQTFWNFAEGISPIVTIRSSAPDGLAISRFEIQVPGHFENGIFEFKVARLNPRNRETIYNWGFNYRVELALAEEISICPLFDADSTSPDVDQKTELQRKAARALELIRRDPSLSAALEAGLNDPHILQSVHLWLPPLIERLMHLFRDEPELNALMTQYSQAFLAAGADEQFMHVFGQYLSSFQAS